MVRSSVDHLLYLWHRWTVHRSLVAVRLTRKRRIKSHSTLVLPRCHAPQLLCMNIVPCIIDHASTTLSDWCKTRPPSRDLLCPPRFVPVGLTVAYSCSSTYRGTRRHRPSQFTICTHILLVGIFPCRGHHRLPTR